jgi:hypothetical protein
MRVLRGAEAEVFRQALGTLADIIRALGDWDDASTDGPTSFDRLTSLQKLALLADVAEALLLESVLAPELTAINEAAVAAVFNYLEICLRSEVEEAATEFGTGSQSWRTLAAAALAEVDLAPTPPGEPGPVTPSCRDFADAPPGQACRMKDLLAISDDYLRAIPPDPKGEDADEIVKRLANVLY